MKGQSESKILSLRKAADARFHKVGFSGNIVIAMLYGSCHSQPKPVFKVCDLGRGLLDEWTCIGELFKLPALFHIYVSQQ